MPTDTEKTSTPPTPPIHPRPEFPNAIEPTFTVFMWGFFTGLVTTVALAAILSEEEL